MEGKKLQNDHKRGEIVNERSRWCEDTLGNNCWLKLVELHLMFDFDKSLLLPQSCSYQRLVFSTLLINSLEALPHNTTFVKTKRIETWPRKKMLRVGTSCNDKTSVE